MQKHRELTSWESYAGVKSAVYENQKASAGRAVPDDKSMRRLLQSLTDQGGKLTSTALARAMGLSMMRLRGLVATACRILNVDGFAVIERDNAPDSISLNLQLLVNQFDLGE